MAKKLSAKEIAEMHKESSAVNKPKSAMSDRPRARRIVGGVSRTHTPIGAERVRPTNIPKKPTPSYKMPVGGPGVFKRPPSPLGQMKRASWAPFKGASAGTKLIRGGAGALLPAQVMAGLHGITPAERRGEYAQGDVDIRRDIDVIGRGLGQTVGEVGGVLGRLGERAGIFEKGTFPKVSEAGLRELREQQYTGLGMDLGETIGQAASATGLLPSVPRSEVGTGGYTGVQSYIDKATAAPRAALPERGIATSQRQRRFATDPDTSVEDMLRREQGIDARGDWTATGPRIMGATRDASGRLQRTDPDSPILLTNLGEGARDFMAEQGEFVSGPSERINLLSGAFGDISKGQMERMYPGMRTPLGARDGLPGRQPAEVLAPGVERTARGGKVTSIGGERRPSRSLGGLTALAYRGGQARAQNEEMRFRHRQAMERGALDVAREGVDLQRQKALQERTPTGADELNRTKADLTRIMFSGDKESSARAAAALGLTAPSERKQKLLMDRATELAKNAQKTPEDMDTPLEELYSRMMARLLESEKMKEAGYQYGITKKGAPKRERFLRSPVAATPDEYGWME
jgi:hypothetical protein